MGNLSADFPLAADTSEIGMLVESIHETKRELKKSWPARVWMLADSSWTVEACSTAPSERIWASEASQMAQGRMDLSIGSDYRGEFRPIQQAMSQILDALNAALSQINQEDAEISDMALVS